MESSKSQECSIKPLSVPDPHPGTANISKPNKCVDIMSLLKYITLKLFKKKKTGRETMKPLNYMVNHKNI